MNTIKGGATSSKSRTDINVGVVTVNQFILDFETNRNNIIKAIEIANERNVKVLGFPELAICGYSCQDHFFERELFVMSYYMLRDIVLTTKDVTENMIVAVGCPIIHKDVRYNCTVFFGNGTIYLIRPKTILADDGNYREARWFTPWSKNNLEDFYFDDNSDINDNTDTGAIPFGVGIINCNGILIGAEICEELWVADNIGGKMFLAGVDILINSSGSHFEKGKQEEKREVLIKATTRKSGGVYIYSNLEGCDGERLYFDGGSIIALNGEIKAVAKRYLLKDIDVTISNINLDDIVTYRMRSNSHQMQSSKQLHFPELLVNMKLTDDEKTANKSYKYSNDDSYNSNYDRNTQRYKKNREPLINEKQTNDVNENSDIHTSLSDVQTISESNSILLPELNVNPLREEIKEYNETLQYRNLMKEQIPAKAVNEVCNTAACWLFDYLERSGMHGFLLPLSGGADSAATSCIVYRMCELMVNHLNIFQDANSRVFKFLELKHNYHNLKVILEKIQSDRLNVVKEICNKILYTVYLPTKFSGVTETFAKNFADQIGSDHHVVSIQQVVEGSMNEITKIPFKIIQNEVKFCREIIQKKEFVDKNDQSNPNYNEQLKRYDISLNKIREYFLTNYSPMDDVTIESLSQTIYGNLSDEQKALFIKNIQLPKINREVYENYLKQYQEILRQIIPEQPEVLPPPDLLASFKSPTNAAGGAPLVPDWKKSELSQNLKNDFKQLNEIHKQYTKKDLYEINKSKWDIPMQNIQARIRMIMAYLIGQMSSSNIYRLNLGSSNSDEVYVGYYTKYDASSADINPIGSLPKTYIERILIVFGNTLGTLSAIINQKPTAELMPGLVGGNQTDEDEIGLKYREMSELSRLMSSGYGPLDSFMKINNESNNVFKLNDVGYNYEKIRIFNTRYRINRHKAVILPPSVHLLSNSPDDNRYNLRPFLYPTFGSSLENEILREIYNQNK